ncbi:MAG: NUDIX domain-containing protein [Bacillaceae bacterium]|nr:NUDIX domain-containing protein [Bacillaceae bacterium]
MESELFTIFNENYEKLGTATREEVHKKGYWHETFHCWFIKRENDEVKILFQLRSERKKESPNLYDITAAGHLLASETIEDGVREIEEEIGISLALENLHHLGMFKYRVVKDVYIDNEFAHVFLYETNYKMEDFKLQEEEVAGLIEVDFGNMRKLFMGESNEIEVNGFKNTMNGIVEIHEHVTKNSFVPHETSYYHFILTSIQDYLQKSSV